VAPVKTILQVAEGPASLGARDVVKMENPVAGEMYLPGDTIKMSKTPAASARSRPRVSTPTKSFPGYCATTG
jgi:hypothetical protein